VKQTHRDEFLKAYYARSDQDQTLKAFWRDFGNTDKRPPYQTLQKHVAKKKKDASYEQRNAGRPPTLSILQESEILRRLEALVDAHGESILTNAIIQGEALDVARIPLPGEHVNSESILDRCKRLGGYKWCQAFRKRHNLQQMRVKRPIEIERALKCQPEFTLLQFRNLAHVYALMMIHRTIASGILVDGWVLPPDSGWVVRDRGPHVGTNHQVIGEPLLQCKVIEGREVAWVIPLQEELKYPEPQEILNFDEKPLIPDSVKLVQYGQAIAYGRTGSWSVVLYLAADGTLISFTLILRGVSVETNVAKAAMDAGGAVTATPKGFQNDQTLLNDVSRLVEKKLIRPTRERPYILLTDGHGSRLTSSFIRLLARHYIYCVIEPSHTSVFTQPLDQQAMVQLQRAYEKELSLSVKLDPKHLLTLLTRVLALVRAVSYVADKKEGLRSSWRRVGLPDGRIDPSALKLKTFATGIQFRDQGIISKQFFNRIFTMKNICAHPDEDILISFTKEDKNWQRFVNHHAPTGTSEPSLTYFLRRSRDPRATMAKLLWTDRRLVEDLILETDDAESDDEDPEPASRGACGRISTANGRIISDPQVLEQLALAETERQTELTNRLERQTVRETENAAERPLTLILRKLEICGANSRPTRAHMVSFFNVHLRSLPLTWPHPFPATGKRSAMAGALIIMIRENPRFFTPTSAAGTPSETSSALTASYVFNPPPPSSSSQATDPPQLSESEDPSSIDSFGDPLTDDE
jgi:hypothetical protein